MVCCLAKRNVNTRFTVRKQYELRSRLIDKSVKIKIIYLVLTNKRFNNILLIYPTGVGRYHAEIIKGGDTWKISPFKYRG